METPLMHYHGAKFRLSPWIISHFPEHKTYCEPFGGAAGVLLNKPRSQSEIYNDLDQDIVNVFRVLQNEKQSARLTELLALTPYSRDEFCLAQELTDDPVEKARRTLIRSYMGFGSASATRARPTGFRIDTARDYGTTADTWAKYPETVIHFIDRLKGVVIENKNAIEVIKNHDREDTLFFVDPPYVHNTRDKRNQDAYNHEMTNEQHHELIEQLKKAEGFVFLSGYKNEIYDELLSDWETIDKRSRISAGRGTAVRIETMWMNKRASRAIKQKDLFGE